MSTPISTRGGRSIVWLGLLSPLASVVLGAGTYLGLTRLSTNPDSDYLLRLGVVALVMLIPPVFALRAFRRRWRADSARAADLVGGATAILALGLVFFPINGAIRRARQAANLALSGVPAPELVARDLDGTVHRLSDHRGSVVLVNIWATWCPPCRAEMPALDRLVAERAEKGLIVFGISTEDESVQQEFRREVLRVDYPLLVPGSFDGEVIPDVFSQTARYPANFLVDREGLLHPAPSTDQPFSALESAVESLLLIDE